MERGKMRRLAVIFSIMFLVPIYVLAQEQGRDRVITTGRLFEEMIDLARLADYPNPPFRVKQFSSYDRRSRLPGGPDWFANSDGFGGEPIPNFERVLKEPDESGVGEYMIADVDGPGAIVRLWTAAISGKVRVYLDGSESPLFEGEADGFFRRPFDYFPQIESVNRDRFQKTIYQRDASYTPIPFAKHLRVVWTGKIKDIHFYQLQVRLYDPGTSVISFSPDDISTYSDIIDNVSLVLSDPDTHLRPRSAEPKKPFSGSIQPSQKKEVLLLERPGAIEGFVLKLQAKDIDQALRQTVLHVICDGYPWGQVQSPVGDFFGAAPGINPCQSLPFTVRPDGTMVCRFVMPFQKSLSIRLENLGTQEVSFEGSVLPIAFSWSENSMHFRARWRVDHDITASNRDVQDLPFLLARGKGVYIGTVSFLLNPNPIPTPWGNWWGEGDEKVFMDDDVLPSLFGTGSEDYYNYSWSSPDIFTFPYCGQPRNDGPGNRGFVTNFRWHILDSIPFNESLRFYIELFSHEPTPGLSYARIGYHYARPGMTDDHLAIMPDDVRSLRLPRGWTPAARFGARNSKFFPAEEILKDSANTHLREGDLWAGGQLLVWEPQKIGDRKDLTLNMTSPGMKKIYITAALTPRSGKFAVLLDGRPLRTDDDEEVIDLFRPYRTLLRNFALKTVELAEGKHTLTLESRGTADRSGLEDIGIDFVWVQTVEK
jgi:hypothetical protein